MKQHEFIETREHQLPASDVPLPGAAVSETTTQEQHTPIGPTPLQYDVRSTYDARPINGYDFNIAVTTNEGSPFGAITRLTFSVPNGLVAVVRRVITFMESPIPVGARRDVLLTLQVNGGTVPNNQQIPVGVEQDDLVNTFFIADENNSVTALFVIAASIVALSPQPSLTAHFYGNFLLKSNVPPQFEIANPIRGKGKTFPNMIMTDAPVITNDAPTPSAPVQPAAVLSAKYPNPIRWLKSYGAGARTDATGKTGPPPAQSPWGPYVPFDTVTRRWLTANDWAAYRTFLNASSPKV